MAKNQNSLKPIDVIIESELAEDPAKKGSKIVVKSLLKFPCKNDNHAALRIFNKDGYQVFYGSARMGNMEKTDSGFNADITNREKEFTGCDYEITEGGTKQVLLQGKIKIKDAEAAKVVAMSTGTAG